MSDVERVVTCDDTEVKGNNYSEPTELLTQAMTKIMESYVNTALGISLEESSLPVTEMPMERSSSTEHSDYSFLTDAFAEDIGRDIAFYIHDDGAGDVDKTCGISHLVPAVQIREVMLCLNVLIKNVWIFNLYL